MKYRMYFQNRMADRLKKRRKGRETILWKVTKNYHDFRNKVSQSDTDNSLPDQ